MHILSQLQIIATRNVFVKTTFPPGILHSPSQSAPPAFWEGSQIHQKCRVSNSATYHAIPVRSGMLEIQILRSSLYGIVIRFHQIRSKLVATVTLHPKTTTHNYVLPNNLVNFSNFLWVMLGQNFSTSILARL